MRRQAGCVAAAAGRFDRLRVLWVAGALGAACGAMGGEVPPSEIVVTATRLATDEQSVPATVHRLDAGVKVMERGARTTSDALGGLPSVMVQKTSYGQGSPYLRGFTGFRTLCMVDGVRLNNSVFRDGPNQYWNTVDPLSVADYEVAMGPASVLYGSDAVGGVVNALSKDPPPPGGEEEWTRRLHLRTASADDSVAGRAEVAGRIDERVGVAAGVSLKRFGDLRAGGDVGTQPHTRYDERGFDGAVDFHLGERSALTFKHQTVEQDDAWRTHRTVHGVSWKGTTIGDEKVHSFDQRRDLSTLRYRSEHRLGFVEGLDLTLSRHRQKEDRWRVRKDDRSDEQGFDVETWGATLQMNSEGDAGRWVYGAEYYRDAVDSYARSFKADGAVDTVGVQGPVADDATYDNLGAFVQDTISLFDGGLDVTPGARVTYARADANRAQDPVTGSAFSLTDDWMAAVGSLRLLRPLSRDRRHVLFAGVSQAYRAPNLSDLTRLDTARSGEIETPSPGLDPEKYVANEIGIKSRVGGFTCRASYYYTLVDKMIVRAPTGGVIDGDAEVVKKNSGEGHIQGAELSVRRGLGPRWSTWASASWTDGEVDAYPTSAAERERDTISRLMPPTARVGVRRGAAGDRWWAELVVDGAADADKLSADDKRDTQRIPPGGTPGYIVCTARCGLRVTETIDVALAVENLFDEDYRIHGSGVNEPGRNLLVTANAAF